MKTPLLLLLLTCCLSATTGMLHAQTSTSTTINKPATLYKLDRSAVKTTVRKVTPIDVYYVELASPNKLRTISKSELWKIVYENGRSIVLNTPKREVLPSASVPMSESLTTRSESIVTVAETPQPVAARQQTAPLSDRPSVETTGARSIIKYAPLSSFGYEHVLNNTHSLYAGISLYSLGFGASAIGLKAEYRFYGLIKENSRPAPEGFWVAPTALLWRVSVSDFYETESAFVAQIGGIAGYQWIFNRKISLEPALGLSLTAVGSGSDTSLGAGVVPLFAVRVGYVLR